jgi:hypothetical protein
MCVTMQGGACPSARWDSRAYASTAIDAGQDGP